MGSVEKRGKKYIMRTVIGYKSNGNPIRKSKTAAATNKREAIKEMNRWEDELLSGKLMEKKEKTFEAFAREEWLLKYAPENIKPRTIERYMELLQQRIFPKIGDRSLSAVMPLELVDIFAAMQNKRTGGPLSRKTKNIVLSAVKSVYQAALLWRLVPYNPAEGVTLGKSPMQIAQKTAPYSETELLYVFNCMMKETAQNRLFLSLAIITGGRLGEIGALQWKHIDYVARTVTFEQSLIKLHGEPTQIQASTKTNVIKKIAIPDALLDLLIHYQIELAFGERYCRLTDKEGFVLGRLYNPNSLRNKFEVFIAKHGIRRIKFHDLRHTAASYLFEEGVSLKEIQNILGHTDINTTASIYTHVSQEKQQLAANKFDKIIPDDFSATTTATH